MAEFHFLPRVSCENTAHQTLCHAANCVKVEATGPFSHEEEREYLQTQ